jgi:hypothetical protein
MHTTHVTTAKGSGTWAIALTYYLQRWKPEMPQNLLWQELKICNKSNYIPSMTSPYLEKASLRPCSSVPNERPGIYNMKNLRTKNQEKAS